MEIFVIRQSCIVNENLNPNHSILWCVSILSVLNFIVLQLLFPAQRRVNTMLGYMTKGIPAFIVTSYVQKLLGIMNITMNTRQR